MRMKYLSKKSFYRRHWFSIGIAIIFCIAVYFLFANYQNRWGLAGDQARDALIAKEAIYTRSIPLFGPFSSAGNFTTGPIWYWWLMVSAALLPWTFLGPWIMLSVAYTGLVLLMIKIGYEIDGKLFALIVGLLAAVSPAQILQSLNLTNPSLVVVFSTLALYFAVVYVKKKRLRDLFGAAACIALAIGAHLQAVYLLTLTPFFLLATDRKKWVKSVIVVALGLTIPSLPYVIADIQHGWYNARGIVDFALYGQYKIYVPNRWFTYLMVFWPELWGRIIGGTTPLGYVAILLVIGATLYAFIKRKLTVSMGMIVGSFVLTVILLRYYKGEKYGGYFMFLHPFILLLTAWVCAAMLKIHNYIGMLVIALFVIGSIYVDCRSIQKASNLTYAEAKRFSEFLIRGYPDKKFNLFATRGTTASASLPIVLFLDAANKLDDHGFKIGYGGIPKYEDGHYPQVPGDEKNIILWVLDSSSSAQLRQVGWEEINRSFIYKNATGWYKTMNDPDGLNKLFQLLFSRISVK
jgi:Dolichyl-phosphate-mannose-protein mannosyltransferase